MTDAELVQRAKDGDTDAFGELVNRYRYQVYGLCLNLLGDFDIANDAAQEAFVQAFVKLRQLRDPEKFVAWLKRIAENVCRQLLRQPKREVPLDETQLPDDEEQLTEALEQMERRELVYKALSQLNDADRLVITLFYVDGLTTKEVAEFLGSSVNAVEVRLHRARNQLKEAMMAMVGETLKSQAPDETFAEQVLRRIQLKGIVRHEGRPVAILHPEKGKEVALELPSLTASYLELAFRKETLPRPMTYELFARIMQALGIRLQRVVLSAEQKRLQASVIFKHRSKTLALSAEPVDALTLATRLDGKVWVTEDALSVLPVAPQPPSEAQPSPSPMELLAQEVMCLSERFRKRAEARKPPAAPAIAKTPPNIHQRRSECPKDWEASLATVTVEVLLADNIGGNPVVLLRDERDRHLPIWIGAYEAQAMAACLPKEAVDAKFPPSDGMVFLHDLLVELLRQAGVTLERVVIDELFDGTYYALVQLWDGRTTHRIDARPSDSIALAVRLNAPILVTDNLLQAFPPYLERTPESKWVVRVPVAESKRMPLHQMLMEVTFVLCQIAQMGADRFVVVFQVGAKPTGEAFGMKVKTAKGWEPVLYTPAHFLEGLAWLTGVDLHRPLPQKGSSLMAGKTKAVDLQAKFERRKKGIVVSARVRPA